MPRKINQNGTDGSVGLARLVKLWPTPRANKIGGCSSPDYRPTLEQSVKLWPTPTINGNYNRCGCSPTSGDGLATAVKMWPTPQARDYRSGDNPESIRQERKKEQGWSNNLNDTVKLWSTPTASMHKHGDCESQRNRATPGLQVKMWPTPRGGENGVGLCGGTGHLQMLHEGLEDKELVRKISAGNGGQLNADWVELLMGFPVGWTNLECETPGDWQGWPAGIGTEQFDYEPPQIIEGQKDRAKRLKTLGNAVVPEQILQFFEAIGKLGGGKRMYIEFVIQADSILFGLTYRNKTIELCFWPVVLVFCWNGEGDNG